MNKHAKGSMFTRTVTRPLGLFALAPVLLLFFAASTAASGTVDVPQPPEADPAVQPEHAVEVPSLCPRGLALAFDSLAAIPMGNHAEEGREIRCNEECDSFEDDCSHICGEDPGLCLPLALASGLCFFCSC